MQHGMPSLRDKSGWRKCNRQCVRRGKWNMEQRWYRIGYLFLRPHPCHTVALDIQTERIRKSQDTGLAGITLWLGPLPLHPFPFPSEHAGVAHHIPYALSSQAHGRGLTLGSETPRSWAFLHHVPRSKPANSDTGWWKAQLLSLPGEYSEACSTKSPKDSVPAERSLRDPRWNQLVSKPDTGCLAIFHLTPPLPCRCFLGPLPRLATCTPILVSSQLWEKPTENNACVTCTSENRLIIRACLRLHMCSTNLV